MKPNNRIFIKFLWQFANKYKFKLLAIFLSVYVLKMANETLFRPYILKILGNDFQENTLTLFVAIAAPLTYAFLYCLDYFVGMTFGWKLEYNTISKLEKDMRIYLMKYAMNHSLNYFNNEMSGSVANKISNITENMGAFLLMSLRVAASYIIFIFIVFVYIKINIYIAIFLIGWTIVFCIAQFFVSKAMYKARSETTKEANRISGLMNDSLSNILNIKAFSNQKKEVFEVKKEGLKLLDRQSKRIWAFVLSNVIMFLLVVSILIFNLGFGFYLTMQKEITMGVFLFICQNMILTTGMVADIYNYTVELITITSDIKDGIDTLLQPIEIKDRENAIKLEVASGKIVIKNMSFKY